jgi:calmodulin
MASYEVPTELVDKFTEDEMKEYVKYFKEADADGSGYLEIHEMKGLVKSLGMVEKANDEETMIALIRKVDENNDGKISLTEFFHMMDSATGDLSQMIHSKLDKVVNSPKKKKKIKNKRKSFFGKFYKGGTEEDTSVHDQGNIQIKLNPNVTDPKALATAATLERDAHKTSFSQQIGILQPYALDTSSKFELRRAKIFLQDGTSFAVTFTKKSRAIHAMVQMKGYLGLLNDNDMGLFVNRNGDFHRALADDDLMFDILDFMSGENVGEYDLVYKRRTYLSWSPLLKEAKEAENINHGAHRINYIEVQKRFLASDYPVTCAQGIELAAMLASCAVSDLTEDIIYENLDSFLPYSIRNQAKGLFAAEGKEREHAKEKQLRHLAHRVFMQAKRKGFYNDMRQLHVEQKFCERCEELYGDMYGDVFFVCNVAERDPSVDVTTDYVKGIDKAKCHVGIGHNGINLVYEDGTVKSLSFSVILRWLAQESEDMFAIWTETQVTILCTPKSEEVNSVVNQYIREFIAANDTPGKMAYPVRVITKKDIRDIFDEFDTDGSGTLDHVEVSELVATFGMNLSQVETQNMFAEIDTNDDGEIQFDEFLPWWENREAKEKRGSCFILSSGTKMSLKMKPISVSLAKKMDIKTPFVIDESGPFLTRKVHIFLQDGSSHIVLLTSKSRVKHVMVQMKRNFLGLQNDMDMGLYVTKNGSLVKSLTDEDVMFPIIDSLDPEVHDFVYKRRTYLTWSPLYAEAAEAKDAHAGAHRVYFIEAEARFLQGSYPATTEQASALQSLLDSRKEANAAKQLEYEREFLKHCETNFREEYGDTFFPAQVIECDPNTDISTKFLEKQPKRDCRFGIGQQGIHLVYSDGTPEGTIKFSHLEKYESLGSNLLALRTKKSRTILYSEVCGEILIVLKQYVKAFVAEREAPGKMAYPKRVLTDEDVRNVFDEFDDNKSGTLDRAEIKEFVTTFGMNLSAEDEQKMFDAVDTNGDGEIQFNEFLPWWKNRDILARLDELPFPKQFPRLKNCHVLKAAILYISQENENSELSKEILDILKTLLQDKSIDNDVFPEHIFPGSKVMPIAFLCLKQSPKSVESTRTVIKTMIEYGCDVNTPSQYWGTNPLTEELVNGRSMGNALFFAANKGWTDVCRALIDRGDSDLECIAHDFFVSSFESTPLWIAVERGHEETAKLLISKGANVNYEGRANWEPLAKWSKYTSKNTGAEFKAPRKGITLLQCAEANNCKSIAKLLKGKLHTSVPLKKTVDKGVPTSKKVDTPTVSVGIENEKKAPAIVQKNELSVPKDNKTNLLQKNIPPFSPKSTFEIRVAHLFLQDNSTYEILLTKKSRVKHALVQMKNKLNLNDDNEMGLYIMKEKNYLLRSLEDEDLMFPVAESVENDDSLRLVYKRRTFLHWSPLHAEAAKATDLHAGAHRICFIEAMTRFLSGDYPASSAQKVELNAMLASEQTLLTERAFVDKCHQYFEGMYGDTFFEVEYIPCAPTEELHIEHVKKLPARKCGVGIGHQGIHIILGKQEVEEIDFGRMHQWLIPPGEDIFAVWTDKAVYFFFTAACEGMQYVVDQYIKEFLAARDTPGQMAYPVRELTEEDIRDVFNEFDEDKSGTLDREEITELIATFGTVLSSAERSKMYTDIDSNGDGEIQFEEFLPWWKNYKENGSKIMDVEDAVPEIGASSQGLPKKPTEISTGENVDNKGSHQSLKQSSSFSSTPDKNSSPIVNSTTKKLSDKNDQAPISPSESSSTDQQSALQAMTPSGRKTPPPKLMIALKSKAENSAKTKKHIKRMSEKMDEDQLKQLQELLAINGSSDNFLTKPLAEDDDTEPAPPTSLPASSANQIAQSQPSFANQATEQPGDNVGSESNAIQNAVTSEPESAPPTSLPASSANQIVPPLPTSFDQDTKQSNVSAGSKPNVIINTVISGDEDFDLDEALQAEQEHQNTLRLLDQEKLARELAEQQMKKMMEDMSTIRVDHSNELKQKAEENELLNKDLERLKELTQFQAETATLGASHVKELEESRDESRQLLQKEKEKTTTLSGHVEKIAVELDKLREDHNRVLRDANVRKQSNEKLNEELTLLKEEKQKDIEILQLTLVGVKEKNVELMAKVEKAEKDASSLRNELSEHKSTFSNVEELLKTVSAEADRLRNQHKDMSRELELMKEAKTKLSRDFEKAKTAYKAEITSLGASHMLDMEKCRQDTLRENESQVNNLEHTVSMQKMKLEAMEESSKLMTHQVSMSKRKLEAMAATLKNNDEHHETMTKMKLEAFERDAQNKTKELKNTIEKLQKQLTSHEESISPIKNKLAAMNSMEETMRSNLEHQTSMAKRIKELQGELVSAELREKTLQEKLDAASMSNIAEKDDVIKRLTTQNSELKENDEALRARCAKAEDTAAALRKELDSMTEKTEAVLESLKKSDQKIIQKVEQSKSPLSDTRTVFATPDLESPLLKSKYKSKTVVAASSPHETKKVSRTSPERGILYSNPLFGSPKMSSSSFPGKD